MGWLRLLAAAIEFWVNMVMKLLKLLLEMFSIRNWFNVWLIKCFVKVLKQRLK